MSWFRLSLSSLFHRYVSGNCIVQRWIDRISLEVKTKNKVAKKCFLSSQKI